MSNKKKNGTDRWGANDNSSSSSPRAFSRRDFIKAGAMGAAGAGLLTLFNYGQNAQKAPQVMKNSMTLTSGYIPIVDSTPIPIAYAKGFFKEQGLRAEKPVLIRAWAPLLEAFIADQVLLTHILLFQVIFMRYAQNHPVRSIAFNHLNGIAMLGGPGIRSMKELGGKVVGCPIWWAPHTLIFQECLRAEGLTPIVDKAGKSIAANEVAFRVLPPPDMPTALMTKAISGAVVSEGFGAAAELLAGSTLLRMSGDVWRNHPCCQSVLMQRTIDKDPSWAQAVTNAIAQACAWCEKNPEETAEILASDGGGYFPMPKKVMKRAILHVDLKEYGVETGTGAIRHPEWNVKRLGFNPYPYSSAFELAVSLMKKTTVDPAVALTPALLKLDPKQAARDIVDYKMITGAINKAGGLKQFVNVNPADPLNRNEEFDVKPLA